MSGIQRGELWDHSTKLVALAAASPRHKIVNSEPVMAASLTAVTLTAISAALRIETQLPI